MGTYDAVPALPLVFLDLPAPVTNRIPRARVTLWAGQGSIGKGTSLVWMAVYRAVQGDHVIMVLPEDDPEVDVRPRLDAAIEAIAGEQAASNPEFVKGVLERIHDLTALPGGAPFLLDATGKTTGGIPELRAMVDNPTDCKCPPGDRGHRHPTAKLVVIDPLMACLVGTIMTDTSARRLLEPLNNVGRETGATIMLSLHTVVGARGEEKIQGSRGLVNFVRLAYIVQSDPMNAALRTVSVYKTNGKKGESFRFTTTEQSNGFPSVSWLTQDELMSRRTSWRMMADVAGKTLGQMGTSEAVPSPKAELDDPDVEDDELETEDEIQARADQLLARIGAGIAR